MKAVTTCVIVLIIGVDHSNNQVTEILAPNGRTLQLCRINQKSVLSINAIDERKDKR